MGEVRREWTLGVKRRCMDAASRRKMAEAERAYKVLLETIPDECDVANLEHC